MRCGGQSLNSIARNRKFSRVEQFDKIGHNLSEILCIHPRRLEVQPSVSHPLCSFILSFFPFLSTMLLFRFLQPPVLLFSSFLFHFLTLSLFLSLSLSLSYLLSHLSLSRTHSHAHIGKPPRYTDTRMRLVSSLVIAY